MKRRVWLSLLFGIALNFVFFVLSTLVMRFAPYKDKPGMPNAFTWLLIPGLVAGSQLDGHRFLALAVAIAINTLLYGVAVFCLISIIKESFARSH